jgi:D-alanyl-D-alanine carboxypeptidase
LLGCWGDAIITSTLNLTFGSQEGTMSVALKLRRGVVTVALLLLGPALAIAQSYKAKADEFLNGFTTSGKFRGVVLVAKDGKPVYQRTYGNAVESWSVPITPNTRFELASLTKQFTGAAILLLAQEGKLNLDDPVSKYYSQAPASWLNITIRQLVHHTSGLPNNEMADFSKGICAPYTPDELIKTFRDRPLKFRPGMSWSYTNTEYYLLAYIIESLTGERYGEFLSHRIFRPLGMNDSGFAPTLAVIPQMADGYSREGGSLRYRNYFDRSLEIGAGGVYSTAGDMLRWNAALDKDVLLQDQWRQVMFVPSSPGNYGFGWFVESGPHPRQYHEGSDPGFAAFEIRYPQDHAFVIVLSNLEDAPVRIIASGLGVLLVQGTLPADLK